MFTAQAELDLIKTYELCANNIVATANGNCRKYNKIKHFLLASTSSVYASSVKMLLMKMISRFSFTILCCNQ